MDILGGSNIPALGCIFDVLRDVLPIDILLESGFLATVGDPRIKKEIDSRGGQSCDPRTHLRFSSWRWRMDRRTGVAQYSITR